ncbi:unnamed protein product [Caenorhabditis nigoni]
MRCFLLLFLIFSISTVIQCLTRFHIDGQLTCDYNKNFKYQITLFEDDWGDDEKIGSLIALSGRGMTNFHLEGQETDDGKWDNYFELYLRIIHNCSPWNNLPHRTFYYDMGSFRIINGEYTGFYSINITDTGDEGWHKVDKRRKFMELYNYQF